MLKSMLVNCPTRILNAANRINAITQRLQRVKCTLGKVIGTHSTSLMRYIAMSNTLLCDIKVL